jgi:hypothetical protein
MGREPEETAPLGDEPETEEERCPVAEAKRELLRGQGIPVDLICREFGVDRG